MEAADRANIFAALAQLIAVQHRHVLPNIVGDVGVARRRSVFGQPGDFDFRNGVGDVNRRSHDAPHRLGFALGVGKDRRRRKDHDQRQQPPGRAGSLTEFRRELDVGLAFKIGQIGVFDPCLLVFLEVLQARRRGPRAKLRSGGACRLSIRRTCNSPFSSIGSEA